MRLKKSMMRLFACLMTLVIIAGLIAACSEPATETTAPTTTAPTTTAAPEKITIIGCTPTATTAPPGKLLEEWSQKFEAAAGDQVELVLYYSSSLFEPAEALKSVLTGVADFHNSYVTKEDPGLMVLNGIFTLPYLGFTDPASATEIYRELLFGDKYPELLEEFQGVKIMYGTIYLCSGWMHSTDKAIQTGADLEGMKFRADGLEAEFFETMGATPVNVPWPDIYLSLEKGLINGTTGGFGAVMGSGSLELYKYHSSVPLALSLGMDHTIINPEKWAAYPPEIKKVWEDLDPWYVERRASLEVEADAAAIELAKEMGQEFEEVSLEEASTWAGAAKPLHDAWIQDTEEKGKPAQALYDEMMRMIAEAQS